MREKAIAIGVMLMLVMTFTPVSAAQEDVPTYPRLFCPDSPLYGLKIALENIDEGVSRSADAKLDKQVAHAEERIAEARAMIEKGKPEVNRVIAKMVPEEVPIEERPEAPPAKGEKKGDKKK